MINILRVPSPCGHEGCAVIHSPRAAAFRKDWEGFLAAYSSQ